MGSADEIVLNGGKQADSSVEAREFVIVSLGAPLFAESTVSAPRFFTRLASMREKRGQSTNVADEGA